MTLNIEMEYESLLSFDSVSYTHLDVYKRQLEKRRRLPERFQRKVSRSCLLIIMQRKKGYFLNRKCWNFYERLYKRREKMRPIWMKLKGLNSFLETQEVDFEQLTSQGLFGIFGPTGSGKSSILDGISLALYGTTARNSTNFINVNTDKASIEYLFSVKTKRERRYLVSRSFKRSKEGSIRSDGAKLVELETTGQKILADRVGTCLLYTSRCV